MSHFTVVVVTEQVPTEDLLNEQLLPFHEFESTGYNAFIEDQDLLPEARTNYQDDTETRYQAPDGTLVGWSYDAFYREPTDSEMARGLIGPCGSLGDLSYSSRDWGDGRGYRPKVREVPEGYTEVDVPLTELYTFEEYVKREHSYERVESSEEPDIEGAHQYGWYRVTSEGEVTHLVCRTNPNSKWDWWVIGGRWSGMLSLFPGKEGINPTRKPPIRYDAARKGDIDFDTARIAKHAELTAQIQERFDLACRKTEKTQVQLLESLRIAAGKSDAISEAFRTTRNEGSKEKWLDYLRRYPCPHVQLMIEAELLWGAGSLSDYFEGVGMPDSEPDPFAWATRKSLFSCFAFLRDKKWAAKGDMGWWAGGRVSAMKTIPGRRPFKNF